VVDLDFNSLAIAYGLLRLPAMPEVRDWRKRREAERVQREKAVAEGKEVESVETIGWVDADVDVSRYLYIDIGADGSGTTLPTPPNNVKPRV